jgi:hypothetical protein
MSNPDLYAAVREAAAGTFDVLGELGATAGGGVVYLARALGGEALVVLKLEPGADESGAMQYFLDVAEALDASVPDVEMHCPRCKAKMRQWARFCTQCGLDVSGEAPSSGEFASRAALREKVRAATADQYEFLGDIPRSEGGGLVYFARDLSDGRIVALRLQKDMNKKLEVGVTRTLKAVEREQALSADRAEVKRPQVTIIQRTPMAQAGAPAGAPVPRANLPRPVPSPNAAPPTGTGRHWKIGRAEIAAVIAIVLILILILTRV